MIEQEIINRDKNILTFFKSKYLIYLALIILIVLGTYIRYLPLTDHGGRPGLWDITTNDYTLGPDLDPFLFLRYAKNIEENGTLPTIDKMRYYPLGFDTSKEAPLLPLLIYYTHEMINSISSTFYSINYAAALLPVIIFAFTILFFFLFVDAIFYKKEKQNHLFAGIIAIISTMFFITIPALLGRTIAGIPEKESAAFLFMFLALWLFLKSWKESDNKTKSILYSIGAGVSTGLMGLSWGGVTFLFVAIGVSALFTFFLNKFKTINYIGYAIWVLSSLSILLSFSNMFTIKHVYLTIEIGLPILALGIFTVHILLDKLNIYTKLKSRYQELKIWCIPENIISIVVAGILIIIASMIFIDPMFPINMIKHLNTMLFNPLSNGRWATTVAENQQPYFVQWTGTFGIYIIYLFLIGSVYFINQMFSILSNKDRNWITIAYSAFLLGLIFSRYAAGSMFDGENFISKFFWLGTSLYFMITLIYMYIKNYKKENNLFEQIGFGELLLLALFILNLFAARSAIRLLMLLATIAPIFIAYTIMMLIDRIKTTQDSTKKIGAILIISLVLLASGSAIYGYYTVTKTQAYNYTPYYYTYQWQQAMSWVRDNTAANAVFAHWWDYGYWVQSIGNRATVTDGGNIIGYWNYLTGRLVLTGDNQKDSLEFLYTHGVTHLLIDSSDIGKYGAFSQIGSDATLDRFSNGPTIMANDLKHMQETKNGTIEIYQGASYLDEDIYYNGTSIFKETGAILGLILEKQNGQYMQPLGVYYNQGRQISLPIRYIYINKTLIDFKTGINATAYPIQALTQIDQGVSLSETGGLIYLSPRVMRGFLGQVYVLNDPFNNFPAFKIDHLQPDFILQQLSMQGLKLDDFVLYNGIRGPIKIWKINYTGEEKLNPKYLNTTLPSEITWQF